MTILRGDRAIGEEETSKRFYPARNMPTTQAGLHTVGFSQVYLSFGEPQSDGSLGLRLYYKPLILLIWIGTIFMALGAGIAMTDRRFRVGAPVRARRDMPQPGPTPAPAE